MLSSPVCESAPELQTSEIPEGSMKHAVFIIYLNMKGTSPPNAVYHFTCIDFYIRPDDVSQLQPKCVAVN
jgi:hypothetical protein